MKIKPLRPRPILLITHRDQLKSVFPHPITVFREQMAMSDKGRDSFVHLSLSLSPFFFVKGYYLVTEITTNEYECPSLS